MKTFYSAEDIETLVRQGVRELVVDDDTVLTAVARETAAQLGFKLVAPGQGKASGTAAAASVPDGGRPAVTPQKPRGCQHGPLGSGQRQAGAPGGSSPVVDELIGAVKQLAKRG